MASLLCARGSLSSLVCEPGGWWWRLSARSPDSSHRRPAPNSAVVADSTNKVMRIWLARNICWSDPAVSHVFLIVHWEIKRRHLHDTVAEATTQSKKWTQQEAREVFGDALFCCLCSCSLHDFIGRQLTSGLQASGWETPCRCLDPSANCSTSVPSFRQKCKGTLGRICGWLDAVDHVGPLKSLQNQIAQLTQHKSR